MTDADWKIVTSLVLGRSV